MKTHQLRRPHIVGAYSRSFSERHVVELVRGAPEVALHGAALPAGSVRSLEQDESQRCRVFLLHHLYFRGEWGRGRLDTEERGIVVEEVLVWKWCTARSEDVAAARLTECIFSVAAAGKHSHTRASPRSLAQLGNQVPAHPPRRRKSTLRPAR